MNDNLYLKKYEIIYVLKSDITNKIINNFILKIKTLINNLNGKSIKINCWGKKKISWKCKKYQQGIYTHHIFLGSNDIIVKIRNILNIEESILLHQIILLNEKINKNKQIEYDDILYTTITNT